MRNKYLFTKICLAVFCVTCTACGFKLNPISDVPASPTSTIESLESIVDSCPDEYFSSEIYAEMIVDDLKDESADYGYELEKVTLIRVVDGDTLVVDYDGEEVKVRLIGVNTPESVASEEYLAYKNTTNSQEGRDASDWVKDLLSDHHEIYLQKDISETDKYGRLLRYVWLDVPTDTHDINEIRTKMLNGVLLDAGVAEVAIYKPDVEYADEFAAIEAGTTDDFEIDDTDIDEER